MAYARWATIRHLKSESEPPFAARTRLIFAVIGASHRHSTRLMIKLRMHWAGCDESSVGLTRRTDSHSAQTWGYFAMPFTSRQSYGWREYERGGEHACELICRCVLLTANSMTAGAERNEFIVWIKGKRIKQLNSYLFFFFFWMYNVQRRCGPANRIAYPYYYFKSWWYTLWGDGKQSRHREWRWWRVHCALVNGRDVRHHSISIVEHTHM